MAANGHLPRTVDPSRDIARGDLPAVARRWVCILNVALVLWILRVPVATTVAGWLLLGATPQAQDLFTEFVDLSWSTWLRMLWFVLMLTVTWALPTHYAARMLVDSDRRAPASNAGPCLRCAAIYLPRLLGLLTFLAVEFAIWRSYANLPTLDEADVIQQVDHALVAMAALVALSAVAYLIWVFKRPHNFGLTGPLGRLNVNLGAFWQAVAPGRIRGSRDEESRDIGRFVLAAVFIVFLMAFLVGADHLAKFFPRAAAIPFILGGWLPFLTYLSGWGRQVRAPLISGLAVLIAFFAVVFGDNHSVRRLRSENLASMRIEDAVDLWMTENRCNPKTATAATDCPRPIIFAAAGGASRAGFMMASIIGYFLDTAEAVPYGVEGLRTQDVRKRIFAISSVSGGSMGAVMGAAALNAASPDSDKPPCVNTAVGQWWGRRVNNWRDCFEALTSGDFLTADFLGLAFNDVLPFALRDRAAVLEDSWRNRFAEVVPATARHNDPSFCQGLDCPFFSLRPQPGHWIPLLVLNGTSEATGRRILTTSLDMTYIPHGPCPTAVGTDPCPLFMEADNFHQLFRTKLTTTGWKDQLGFLEHYLNRGTASDDVRVSTAALNSARFPFISPPGSIRNQDALLVDRIVDGGYFENYGALAGEELALAVTAIAPRLRPLVIVISNDPADLLDPTDDVTPHQPGLARPHAAGGEVLTEVTAPITTFANTRTAHGVSAVVRLRNDLHSFIDCDRLVIQVRISPDDDKQLSMSWWESPLVQRRIHRQTERSKDPRSGTGAEKNQNLPHLEAIWKELQTPSCRGANVR
jgi:hypothetical protein